MLWRTAAASRAISAATIASANRSTIGPIVQTRRHLLTGSPPREPAAEVLVQREQRQKQQPQSRQALGDARPLGAATCVEPGSHVRTVDEGVLPEDPLEEEPVVLERCERNDMQWNPLLAIRDQLPCQVRDVEDGVVQVADQERAVLFHLVALQHLASHGESGRDLGAAAEVAVPRG